MRRLIICGLAAATFVIVQANAVQARFNHPVVQGQAPLFEAVACRTVKTQTRVNGRVVTKSVRRCSPTPTARYGVTRCVNERVRVRTAAGALVYRSVRRCR